MFENRVLRRIFGPKRYGVIGEWRKLHNEELNVPYTSHNIVRLIKSRRMKWSGHVARIIIEFIIYFFAFCLKNLVCLPSVSSNLESQLL